MTALLPSPAPLVVWRQLRPRLWTGRADGHHLGTIEHGHGFTVTDLDGGTRHGYRTLQAAQAALTGEVPVIPSPAPTVDSRRTAPPLLVPTTAAMLVAVALSTVGLAVLR